MFYDYADSGSWTEGTYRANESDFQKHQAAPAGGGEHGKPQSPHYMVGRTWRCRWRSHPTGLTGMQHADGEILAARAAEKFGIPFTLSTMSICSIEDIAENTSAPFWFQLYMMKRPRLHRAPDRPRQGRPTAAL
jgi:L-lactate dehydrogenase (cytochrome)